MAANKSFNYLFIIVSIHLVRLKNTWTNFVYFIVYVSVNEKMKMFFCFSEALSMLFNIVIKAK